MAGPLPPLQSSKTRLTNPGIPLVSEFRGGESDTVREIPPEWRAALDLHVTEQSIPFDQDLFELTDEILASKVERTLTSEKKIRTTRKPAGVFTLLEKFTNKDKEYGTRTRKFRFIDDFPAELAVPSATREVSTKNFGNKHFEEIIEDIPSVFDAESFNVERPVVTPEDFRALLQEHEHCVTDEGQAVEPTLVAGDISRSDVQEDLFLHRECRKFIDFSSLPRFIINYDTNQVKQVEQITRFLLEDDTIPAVPTATRDVKFTKLGDGSALEIVTDIEDIFERQTYETARPEVWPERFRAQSPLFTRKFREEGIAGEPTLTVAEVRRAEQQEDDFVKSVESAVRNLPSLPTAPMFGQRYEDTFDQVIPYSEWIDTAGTNLGSPRTVVTPQGDGTEQVEQLDFTSVAAALDAYSSVFPGTTNLNNKLPDVLTELASVFEVNSGNGSFSETGAAYWTIRGSYSLSIRGSGNGSAAIVADADFLLQPPFKPAAKTRRTVFFLPNPVTTADVLTKLSAILGVSVLDWPDFDPTPVTVKCTSRKVSVRAEANQHTQSGGSGIGADDPCEDEPDCVACDAASTTGTGISTEVGITIKTIRIPACLHGVINLNDTQDELATARAYAYDGSSSGVCNPPAYAPADTGLIELVATGTVVCTAAATSTTTYPTGTFLLDTSAQPYKYGYAIIHAEVVDL